MKKILLLCLFVALCSYGRVQAESSVFEVFEHPAELTTSSALSISVGGESVFVYDTRVNHAHSWSWTTPETTNPVALFDFDNFAEVTLTYPYQINSVKISPLADNVETTINGNIVTITLTTPQAYVIEVNGDVENVLHLFTNYIDHNKPDPNNLPSNMIYYGPGVHNVGQINVPSNKTVYLAGGAYLNGKFFGYNVSNVTMMGRGIVNGSTYVRDEMNWYVPFEFIQSDNITLDGLTFLDPAGWVIHSNFNEDLIINRVNMISARQNGDGVSLQSNHNVVVTNVFARTWDDSLVVKNYNNGTTSNILFDGVTIWTDLAQSIEIGFETMGATMDSITFQDITVIHNFHKPVLSIHNGDYATISNVVFRDIVVEDATLYGSDDLIDISVVYSPIWSKSGTRGSIDGVLIENMTVLDGEDHLNINIKGYDETHRVSNITIRNLVYKGTVIDETTDMDYLTNSFVDNVVFEYVEYVNIDFTIANQTIEAGSMDIDWTKYVENIIDNGTIVNFTEKDAVDYDTPGEYQNTIIMSENNQMIEKSFTITVVDTTVPSVTVEDITISSSFTSYDFTAVPMTISDNSDLDLRVELLESNVMFGVAGTYFTTLRITDGVGNITDVTFYVTIENTVVPTFDTIPTQYIMIGDSVDFTSLLTNVSSVNGEPYTTYVVSSNVNFNQLGVYTVEVGVQDGLGKETVQQFTVHIIDSTVPKIALLPGIDTIGIGEVHVDAGITVSDNTETSIQKSSDLDVTLAGTYTITYTVTDQGGNTASLERKVFVTAMPKDVDFQLESDITTLPIGSTYQEAGCTVMIEDNVEICDVDNSNLNLSQAGIYYVEYSYTLEGITYTYLRYIFVYDETSELTLYYIKPKVEVLA